MSFSAMTYSFLSSFLKLPGLDELVDNSEITQENKALKSLSINKTPTLMIYYHSYKMLGISLVPLLVSVAVLVFFQIKKSNMPWVLARVIWFFIFKIYQVLLIESMFFMLICSIQEYENTIYNGGYIFFSTVVVIFISLYFISHPFHFLLNTLWLKSNPRELYTSILGAFYDDLHMKNLPSAAYYFIFMGWRIVLTIIIFST